MPRAQLPTGFAGWLVFVAVGTVGAIAGFLFLSLLNRIGVR